MVRAAFEHKCMWVTTDISAGFVLEKNQNGGLFLLSWVRAYIDGRWYSIENFT